MFTREPRLQLEKFAINGAKRLLQHNLPQGDIQSSIRLFRRRGASAHQPRRAAALRKRLSTNAEASPTSATGARMAGAAGQPKDSTQRPSTAGPAN
jgi:hypothetical protein